jgi:putative ATPase
MSLPSSNFVLNCPSLQLRYISSEKEREAEVPNHLKDANRDKKGLGHGAGYFYPHAYRDHWVAQQYLPSSLQGQVSINLQRRGLKGKLRHR